MTHWCDDLSKYTFEQVLLLKAENRAWNKELRIQATVLVNTRLARSISQEQYAERRKVAHEEVAECRRRAGILEDKLVVLAPSLRP